VARKPLSIVQPFRFLHRGRAGGSFKCEILNPRNHISAWARSKLDAELNRNESLPKSSDPMTTPISGALTARHVWLGAWKGRSNSAACNEVAACLGTGSWSELFLGRNRLHSVTNAVCPGLVWAICDCLSVRYLLSISAMFRSG
jgi:hypothetical protein